MKTIQVNVYSFAELDPKAQAKVLDKFREWASGDFDGSYTLDYYKTEKATERCFEIKDIFWSGFGSQGDGASWKGAVKVIPWLEKNQPDNPLLKYREAFEEYCTEIRIGQEGHYYHSNTMFLPEDDLGSVLDFIFEREGATEKAELLIKDLRAAILKDAKDFAWEIYNNLQEEYEYQTSDECIKENIELNEREFFADGRLV
jgi:hypothetical protein